MKVVTIIGTRPQFIKCAPVSRELRKVATEHIVNTGQHYDWNLSDVFIKELHLAKPDDDLNIGSGSHGVQCAKMMMRIEKVLQQIKPHCVLVYGDTNSTLAGALTAAKLNIPVAHIEAGLRSYNPRMPEEINRVVTDHVSNIFFCPTKRAIQNLKKEGISEAVYFVGDVMYDLFLQTVGVVKRRSSILKNLQLKPKGYVLVTIHRAENTNDPKRFRSIFHALEEMAHSGITVVIPLHPRSRKQLAAFNLKPCSLTVIQPVSYFNMLTLQKHARCILTDSGGVQKEAYFLKVPCLTLRDETEWPETIETGWNVLVGADSKRIVRNFRNLQTGSAQHGVFGNGRAAHSIARILVKKFVV